MDATQKPRKDKGSCGRREAEEAEADAYAGTARTSDGKASPDQHTIKGAGGSRKSGSRPRPSASAETSSSIPSSSSSSSDEDDVRSGRKGAGNKKKEGKKGHRSGHRVPGYAYPNLQLMQLQLQGYDEAACNPRNDPYSSYSMQQQQLQQQDQLLLPCTMFPGDADLPQALHPPQAHFSPMLQLPHHQHLQQHCMQGLHAVPCPGPSVGIPLFIPPGSYSHVNPPTGSNQLLPQADDLHAQTHACTRPLPPPSFHCALPPSAAQQPDGQQQVLCQGPHPPAFPCQGPICTHQPVPHHICCYAPGDISMQLPLLHNSQQQQQHQQHPQHQQHQQHPQQLWSLSPSSSSTQAAHPAHAPSPPPADHHHPLLLESSGAREAVEGPQLPSLLASWPQWALANSLQSNQHPPQLPAQYPSLQHSQHPSHLPTQHPSQLPTQHPTQLPAWYPPQLPSQHPSQLSSQYPSKQRIGDPSQLPPQQPSQQRIGNPSQLPTQNPSQLPTHQPSQMPSQQPSFSPPVAVPSYGATAQSETTAAAATATAAPQHYCPIPAPALAPGPSPPRALQQAQPQPQEQERWGHHQAQHQLPHPLTQPRAARQQQQRADGGNVAAEAGGSGHGGGGGGGGHEGGGGGGQHWTSSWHALAPSASPAPGSGSVPAAAYVALLRLLEVKDRMIWHLLTERNELAERLCTEAEAAGAGPGVEGV